MKKNPFVDHCLRLDQLPKGMGLRNCLDPDPDFRLDLDPDPDIYAGSGSGYNKYGSETLKQRRRIKKTKKKDKDRKEDKGRRCCLGDRIASIPCRTSYFPPG